MNDLIKENLIKNSHKFDLSIIKLKNNFLSAKISTFGATLVDLKFRNEKNSLILKYDTLSDYIQDSNFIGCTIGRFANRLKGNNFNFINEKQSFSKKNNENIVLHSGKNGINKKIWKILDFSNDFVSLSLLDEETKTYLPGNLYLNSFFKLIDNKLIIIYHGKADKKTLCNITNHSYFSLDNSGHIRDHQIKIFSDIFLPTNNLSLPTGEIKDVKNTKFDFTILKKINDISIDNNYCFENTRKIKRIAFVKSEISNVSLTLFSTATGVQFYTGDNLKKKIKKKNVGFSPKSGFCLEPQSWPNSPNIKNFPSAILLPDNRFFQMNIIVFQK